MAVVVPAHALDEPGKDQDFGIPELSKFPDLFALLLGARSSKPPPQANHNNNNNNNIIIIIIIMMIIIINNNKIFPLFSSQLVSWTLSSSPQSLRLRTRLSLFLSGRICNYSPGKHGGERQVLKSLRVYVLVCLLIGSRSLAFTEL
jgi:hypothetical protein